MESILRKLLFRVGRKLIGKAALTLLGVLVLSFILVPFLMIVFTAFKTPVEISAMARLPLWQRIIPADFTNLGNFRDVLTGAASQLAGISFLIYVRNSVNLVLITIFPATILTVLAGYGFAKFTFPLKNLLFWSVMVLLMVPEEMISIPLYQYASQFGLLNTLTGLALPHFASAFGILLLRETIEPIPNDYSDSARVDGANELQVLLHCIIPMAKTGIVTFVVIKVILTWNSFFWPLLVVTREEMKIVPLALSKFTQDLFTEYSQLSAAVVISLVPTLLVYAFSRRYIRRGIMLGGIK